MARAVEVALEGKNGKDNHDSDNENSRKDSTTSLDKSNQQIFLNPLNDCSNVNINLTRLPLHASASSERCNSDLPDQHSSLSNRRAYTSLPEKALQGTSSSKFTSSSSSSPSTLPSALLSRPWKYYLSKPQRWSLSFLVITILIVASTCSILINSAAVLMIHKQHHEQNEQILSSASSKSISASFSSSADYSFASKNAAPLTSTSSNKIGNEHILQSSDLHPLVSQDKRSNNPETSSHRVAPLSVILDPMNVVPSSSSSTKTDNTRGIILSHGDSTKKYERQSQDHQQKSAPRLVFLAPDLMTHSLGILRTVHHSDVMWSEDQPPSKSSQNITETATTTMTPNSNVTKIATNSSELTQAVVNAKSKNSSKVATVASNDNDNTATVTSFDNIISDASDDDDSNEEMSNNNNPGANTSSSYEERMNARCIPWAKWQTANYLNCNRFHEIDMPFSAAEMYFDDETHNVNANEKIKNDKNATLQGNKIEEEMSVLGEGWFRTAWKFQDLHTTTVVKTLRLERDFLPEYYELHRRDAVAMERLTASDFVVNVFGFCGNSAINEIADFPYEGLTDLEHFDRRMRRKMQPQIQRIKLQIAASIAQGVADIHAIDEATDFGENNPRPSATMVHYDLNPRNIAMFAHGRPKINDFNIAEFLYYDPATNKTCGFLNRMHQPWWRAPEEVVLEPKLLDEKVDVFALGNILFHVLTTHAPHGKMKAERMEAIRQVVAQGIRPIVPAPFNITIINHHGNYNNTNNTATVQQNEAKHIATQSIDSSNEIVFGAFLKAMDRCFEYNPKQRATAHEIVEILLEGLEKVFELDEKMQSSAHVQKRHSKRSVRRKK